MTKEYIRREKSGADKMELERFTLGVSAVRFLRVTPKQDP
jgi:hypothetical protein